MNQITPSATLTLQVICVNVYYCSVTL